MWGRCRVRFRWPSFNILSHQSDSGWEEVVVEPNPVGADAVSGCSLSPPTWTGCELGGVYLWGCSVLSSCVCVDGVHRGEAAAKDPLCSLDDLLQQLPLGFYLSRWATEMGYRSTHLLNHISHLMFKGLTGNPFPATAFLPVANYLMNWRFCLIWCNQLVSSLSPPAF